MARQSVCVSLLLVPTVNSLRLVQWSYGRYPGEFAFESISPFTLTNGSYTATLSSGNPLLCSLFHVISDTPHVVAQVLAPTARSF